MTKAIQVGNYTIATSEVVPLLAKYQMLPQLLRELILDNAIASIDCTAEEVFQAQQQFYTEHRFTQEADVNAWLEYQGLIPEQIIAISTRKLKIEKFKQATWGNKLEAYFLECKGKLDKVIYSLLRTQDIGVIQELFFRIQAKEQSFAELAREYSLGPEAQTGGLVGPVEINTLHPMMTQLLSSSQPGQLLPPNRIGEWFVIMRLEKFIPAQLDELTRIRLLNELFEIWLKERIQQTQRENKLCLYEVSA